MSKPKSKIQEYAEAIIIAILIALFIRTFIVQAFKIPSEFHEADPAERDHILVNKFLYGVKIPFVRKTLIPIGIRSGRHCRFPSTRRTAPRISSSGSSPSGGHR
jgi:signal peptidase I